MNSDPLINHLRPWVLALMIVATSPTMTMAWNPFVPEPIFDAFLAPMFAECGCPAYGVEEVQTWEDITDPTIKYYKVTVVLILNHGDPGGWYGESRDYLFKIIGNGRPTIDAMSDTETWPADAELAY